MSHLKISKVLIANRGEIALRIMRTLKKLNIQAVAIYSKHDEHAWHTEVADEAWPLGNGTISETYLNVQKIIEIAKQANVDAIHPGYGFLSENPALIQACEQNNIIFIGPDAQSIRLMGNKIEARKFAEKSGLPITQGLTGKVDEMLAKAITLEFPVLVKAAAGGGGKGMRVVNQIDELEEVLEATSREAKNYFGDGTVYIEQFIVEPRHIEVQVLGDKYGNIIHLFERECSIQRRYQKIIEESPSVTLSPEIREQMGMAAVKLCKQIGYQSAGTIEFLVDQKRHFYFLEMNTRIQVEHPVTEMVTGYDLIEEQLMIAQGIPLRINQEDVKQTGHAIECRIYAEDPQQQFLPSPGLITLYREPAGQNIRVDSSMNQESEVLSFYDPMISKLIVWGQNRNEAISLAQIALQKYIIHGIKTNVAYLTQLLQHPDFVSNNISTKFCDTQTSEILHKIQIKNENSNPIPFISAFLIYDLNKRFLSGIGNIWEEIGYWRNLMQFKVLMDKSDFMIEILTSSAGKLSFQFNNTIFYIRLISLEQGKLSFVLNEHLIIAFVSEDEEGNTLVQHNDVLSSMRRNDQMVMNSTHHLSSAANIEGSLFAPMPGKVLQVNVKLGDKVSRGKILMVVEAMKMENNIVCPFEAIVEKVFVKEGDMVDPKTELILLNDQK